MNIIALEALTFGLGRLADAAKKNGCTLTLLTRDKTVYDYELSRPDTGAIKVIEVDTFCDDAVTQAIRKEKEVAAILSMTDTWSLHCLTINERLGLPDHNPDVIRLIRDKYRLRNHLYNAGLSAGKSKLVDPRRFDRATVVKDINYPCIVKDTAGTGSQNVWIAYGEETLIQILDKASSAVLRGQITVEPFFSGTLYSLETLSWQGETRVIALTSRIMSPEPFFREEAFSSPVMLDVSQSTALQQWITTVFNSLDYGNGFAHTEFMFTENGFEVIEINPRLGGVQIGEALCQSLGMNIYESWIEMALNKRPALIDAPLPMLKGIGQIIVYASEAGEFSHIEGLERLTTHPGNPVFYPTAYPGKRINTIDDQRSSVGILFAEGHSSETALLNVYAARNKLRVVMKA
ncbi:ATP-grasp domain-containing protein [Xenorhabdus sp. IM139775]|uniref:ATP-grasp domain-containing protein n=1 Tax=Xenorhabdus sp. IM139775 TaxID=3025876 RepID=UPI00235A0555|nr:ATP-grasp domain-containing protein [Xenorhabdus sp. IM139775]MDC9594777.1 ATP-grasp domain-containing protein [Xenorhabdus sp. IM139775]